MDKRFEKVSVLACAGERNIATKTFSRMADGAISKRNYDAGKYFYVEEFDVSDIYDLHALISKLADQPKKFIIRGRLKDDVSFPCVRQCNGNSATFEKRASHLLLVDIDGVSLPSHLNAAHDPESVIRWVLGTLPTEFQSTTCVYQFSSSQNITAKLGSRPEGEARVHLWFWCDRAVADDEWRRYLEINAPDVDRAIFTAVQPHFTANPQFENMSDPLSKRVGVLNGASDLFRVPNIPLASVRASSIVRHEISGIDQDKIDLALSQMHAFYPQQGGRSRFCGAVISTLYRGGWGRDDIGSFIYNLAVQSGDEEAISRERNVDAIVTAVDRGDRVQGIPTLMAEFKMTESDLSKFQMLLGIGAIDPAGNIEGLSKKSDYKDIEEALRLLIPLRAVQKEEGLQRIKALTGQSMGALKATLKSLDGDKGIDGGNDEALQLVELFLIKEFAGGRHLLRTQDVFWHYCDGKWENISENGLKQKLLAIAPISSPEHINYTALTNNALDLIRSKVYKSGDPLRFHQAPPRVINCRNGELWLENGELVFKPHCPESFLRNRLDVDYDPSAIAPNFNKAVSDIFQNSSNPSEMERHLYELMGYIIQPSRKIPCVALFYGAGSNGKTKIANIIEKFLGQSGVMSDRINDIEGHPFKIGALSNKLLLLDDDVDAGALLPDGLLKKISEEKIMTGEHKFRPSFEFTCRAFPLMLSNTYPSIKDMSHGMRRRMMIIPFNRVFTADESDPEIFDRIWHEERAGILNILVEGFLRLEKRTKFDPPKDCLEALDDWLSHANPLLSFINEACEKGMGCKQPVSDLSLAYERWAADNRIRHTLSRTGFVDRLVSLGYEIKAGGGRAKVVHGIRSNYLAAGIEQMIGSEKSDVIRNN